jgi:hypothetical protein
MAASQVCPHLGGKVRRCQISLEDAQLVVDTPAIIEGLSRQATVLEQSAEGPSCLVGRGSSHLT